MPTSKKKKSRGRSAKRQPTAGDRIKSAWDAAVGALGRAESEMQRQVRQLLSRNKITSKDARKLLDRIRARVQRERKTAARQIQGRLDALQGRLGKERKALGKVVENAVQQAMGALNIPSRKEISELTRKVEVLSKKIDSLKT